MSYTYFVPLAIKKISPSGEIINKIPIIHLYWEPWSSWPRHIYLSTRSSQRL